MRIIGSHSLGALTGLALMLAMAPKAEASYIVTLQQVGNDVVATGSGSLNTSALTSDGTANVDPTIAASAPQIYLGATGGALAAFYYAVSGPSSFGPGGSEINADSGSGSRVGVDYFNSHLDIAVPESYTSGASLGTSTATWTGQTIASLELTPGTYTWTWGSGLSADSFTLNIVPEPASLALLGVGLLGLGLARRRRTIATSGPGAIS